ncbi:extracellular solute-binding protein [Bailinhaonella thermotolerans]|uniref:Extracellular solute-binding protein n=1 Tax=Bailinhaonella thermotolerans TaxID=1070861 RepID=A0A3A4BP49_9ACTN|nr:extracellular solute-binding protein [Bailinhaonella thermotolerans]RJL32794.1 extracellular solute-binding protein [Bailinhaonella thermotolerans]
MSSNRAGMDRRGFLRAAAGAALLTAGGGPLLAACGGGGGGAVRKAGAISDVLPAHVPIPPVTPDLPGTAQGVPPGYFSYPRQLTKGVARPPLGGGNVKIMAQTFAPLGPGRAENAAWREVEKRAGGTLDLTIVPTSDWGAKFNTTVAGGQLPDMFVYDDLAGITNLPAFAASQCAHLAPHISGDAVKAYPNLANIGQIHWKDATVGGKLYGIPIPRALIGGAGFYRHDLFEKAGATDLRTTDDLFDALKEVTRPKEKVWGVVSYTGASMNITIFAQLFGAPFEWKVDPASGKFTADLESPQYRAAVEFARRLYEAGCYYPGSEGFNPTQRKTEFGAGKAALTYDGLPAYYGPNGYAQTLARVNADYDVRPFVPFTPESTVFTNNINFSYVMLKKADEGRVKELLRLADFFASPFGSEEYTLLRYGVEGVHHKRDGNGNPILTEQGTKEVASLPWSWWLAPPYSIYEPTSKAVAEHAHAAMTRMIPRAVQSAELGLYSPAWQGRYEALRTLKSDRITSIVVGRAPMSDYDKLVKDWLAAGGEQARKELEQAYAQAKSGGKN